MPTFWSVFEAPISQQPIAKRRYTLVVMKTERTCFITNVPISHFVNLHINTSFRSELHRKTVFGSSQSCKSQ